MLMSYINIIHILSLQGYASVFTFTMSIYSTLFIELTFFYISFCSLLPEVKIRVTLAYYSDGSLCSTYELCNTHVA